MARAAIVTLLAGVLALAAGDARTHADAGKTLMQLELHLRPDARSKPQLVLMTLGGPIYCGQLKTLARNLNASLVCSNYALNHYVARGGIATRQMDWGDPTYLAEVARVPDRLRARGVKIAKLVFVGVSYSGYANAEFVATHPELRPAALIVVDSYLDLPARYRALVPTHHTKVEMEKALGGTLDQNPRAYEQRSPSNHLEGLAETIRHGMRFVDVWSTSPGEEKEFRGATCSRLADAEWLARLATILRRPVTGYVTQLPHAHALWDRGRGVLALAGVTTTSRALGARAFTFRPNEAALPAGSYCGA